jgi:hypothetical protein
MTLMCTCTPFAVRLCVECAHDWMNGTYERFIFNQRVQEPNENVDTYVTSLKTLAKTCNFGSLEESLVRDKIVI